MFRKEFAGIGFSEQAGVKSATRVYYKRKYVRSASTKMGCAVEWPWTNKILYVNGNEADARELILGFNDYRHMILKLKRGDGWHYVFIKSEQV